jgi:hypothetical protein
MTEIGKLTAKSLKLFIELAEDAPNWNGQPMFDGTKEERGNLTQLKKAGLVKTMLDEGCVWVTFTDAGEALAAKHGLEIW